MTRAAKKKPQPIRKQVKKVAAKPVKKQAARVSPQKSNARRYKITMITGNAKKLEEFKQIMTGALSKAYDVTNQSLDLPELQGKPDEIAKHKVQLAAKLIDGPAIVEDVSLHFRAWNGMPGPYIKDFMNSLGCDGIFKALQGCSSKVVTALCTYAFCEGPGKEPVLF